jgi:hypothetical protein
MMKKEFEALTGIFPSDELYKAIEAAYYDFAGDKTAFCKAYKANKDGIAERIQHEVDMAAFKAADSSSKAIAQRDTEIENLKKQLERELEWRPLEDKDNVSQSEYTELATAGGTKRLTDDEAKTLLYNWYGFAKEKIIIQHTIPTYEVNRHRQLRQVGEIDRAPLYNATDWNYIRFDCGCMAYELHNDTLRPFIH